MGQASTFLLHRQGAFQFWEDNWQSKNNFQKNITDNFFLKNCLYLFFKHKNYLNWKIVNFKNFFLVNKNLNMYFDNSKDLEYFLIEEKKFFKNFFFLGNINIFRLQNINVVNIYIYMSKKKKKRNIKTEDKINLININNNTIDNFKNFFKNKYSIKTFF